MSRLPPVEKLPLAARKNLRDDWENKKEGFENQLSEVLGAAWKVDIDPKQIFAYATDGYAKEAPGSMIAEYVSSAVQQLKDFVSKFGDSGKAEINHVCSAHSLTMDLDIDQKFPYCGCDVSPSGQLVILFAEGSLAVNIHDAVAPEKLTKALNDAPAAHGSDSTPPPGLSYNARRGIETVYDPKVDETRRKLAQLLDREDVKLEPNFDDTFAKIKAAAAGGEDDKAGWEDNLGMFTLGYFDGLPDWLRENKFGEDVMLQEGFNEAVDKAQVQFRVVGEGGMKRSYNECVVEDGVLYLQTSAKMFGVNLGDVSNNLMDLL